jgi:broad specificity phosphatase PhoE
MVEIYVIRPGSTSFDEAGRIKGALDIPLSPLGIQQAETLAETFRTLKLDCLYVGPCSSAQETASRISNRNFCRLKTLDYLKNLDHGLWQGKLMSEVKRLQPTFYRQFQENPMEMCPPNGETVQAVLNRIRSPLLKLLQKHEAGVIGFLAPEPMASVVHFCCAGGRFGDIWKSERDSGTFNSIHLSESANSLPIQFELA